MVAGACLSSGPPSQSWQCDNLAEPNFLPYPQPRSHPQSCRWLPIPGPAHPPTVADVITGQAHFLSNLGLGATYNIAGHCVPNPPLKIATWLSGRANPFTQAKELPQGFGWLPLLAHPTSAATGQGPPSAQSVSGDSYMVVGGAVSQAHPPSIGNEITWWVQPSRLPKR